MSLQWVAVAAVVSLIELGTGVAQVPATARIVVIEAQISPDGRTVAFIRARRSPARQRRGLFRIAFAGGDPQQLVAPTAILAHVKWSPDGRQVAFVSQHLTDRTRGRVLIIPADGGEARTIVDVETDVTALEWSFDGQRLAYMSRSRPTPYVVDLVPAGNSQSGFPDMAASGSRLSVAGATTLFANAVGRDQQSLTLSNGQGTWIDLLAPATKTRITVMPIGIATILAPPSWSADGSRFAAVGETSEHGAEVFAGALPIPMPNRPDWVGAPPPAVRRITFSNP